MSLSRKMRRKQERALKKEMAKKTRAIENKVHTMPKSCDECDAPFDKTDQASLNEWRIAVYDDGPIHLVCPACVPAEAKGG